MKKNHGNENIEAEAVFAADLYRDRSALNSKAQGLLAAGSRQVTIRLSNNEIARANSRRKPKGSAIRPT